MIFPGLLPGGGGGVSHWHGIRICACLLGHFFAKFGIAIGGFSSETKEPKLHKLGVFWANYCKKHLIWSKLGDFLSKMVYWWVGNLAKNWYRDSQIFEVRQAHPRTILVKEPPRVYSRPMLLASLKHVPRRHYKLRCVVRVRGSNQNQIWKKQTPDMMTSKHYRPTPWCMQ